MKKIAVLWVLLVSLSTIAQNDEAYVDGLTQEFTTKLESRGLTQYFTAKRYCMGRIEMFQIGRDKKWCTSKGTYYEVYVVWKEEDQVHLKKIDNCSMYYSVALEDSRLFDFFESNVQALKTEAVKHYKSASYNGIPVLRKKPQPCSRSYSFTENGETARQTYNLFAVNPEAEADNINYNYNSGLKVIELDALLDNVLADYKVTMRRQI
jgi:hypothetical protein